MPALRRILVRSGKHPFEPFDYHAGYDQMMQTAGKNLGNFLFADAVFKYLYASEAHSVESDHYGLLRDGPEMTADALNERYDCLVIPAANWLSGESRDMLGAFARKIRQLRMPVVLTGIGVQAHDTGDFSFLESFAEEAKDFLSAVCDRSHSLSVRGEFTAECVRRLGFKAVNVTGCPSFYRNLRNLVVTRKPARPETFRVAVNGNAVLLSKMRRELFDRYESNLFSQGDVLKVLKSRWKTPWADFRFALADGFSMRLLAQNRVRYYGDVEPWLAELRSYDFSVGTRIHGNIAALLAGVPAVVIAHDSRTREMAEFFRIPCRRMQELRRGFDVYRLYEEADFGPLHGQYPALLSNMAAFLEQNGLEHTLYAENGSTPYDRAIRQLSFPHAPAPEPRSFLTLTRALAPVFSGLKSLRRDTRLA